MGSHPSKRVDDETLSDLYLGTEFNELQIQQIYEEFIKTTGQVSKDTKEWEVNKTNFRELASKFFPQQKSEIFADEVFRVYDQDKNGMLNFREFLVGISILKKAPIEDKLTTVFNLYDIDGSGAISREELEHISKAIDSFTQKNLSKQFCNAKELFEVLDTDHDGKVTFHEFRKVILADRKLFQLFDF